MKFVADGIIQVHYVADIANEAFPTLTEISGGTDLTAFLRSIDTPLEGNLVDAATADSAFNSTVRGTYGGQPVAAEFTRDSNPYGTGDTAWNLLPFGTTGFFVVARRGGSGTDGALQHGNKVDVFPIDVTARNPAPYGRNELSRFMVQAGVPTPPTFDAVVVVASS